ncbi:uncharacterized protein LOC115017999 isoform X2 [Cottoperca gobio]|uniref:Uncharacterized protein LOC115017999 isoform X2 n=1 Tax=Cottoperca gobio TaxID=56716 RepID=A0A6J2QVM5_COTGO|nr:uncharacterized protein LOC115017999 isoform X2 [Cottoperca gobio]
MCIFLLALCFIHVSSNEPYFERSCELNSDVCETHTRSAPLGSSVLLPCNFETSNLNWVSWTHSPGVDLLRLTSAGRIKFLDPRHGRVKAFPIQGSQGNYSICIDELNNSDLGCYLCKQGDDCLQVELVVERGALSREMVYICVSVTAFILLSVGGYCCMKCILCCNNLTRDNTNNPEGAGTEGVSSEETGRVPVDQQQRGAGHDNLVYENDDQDQSQLQDDLSRYYGNTVSAVLPDPDMTQPAQSASGIYPNLNQFEGTENLGTKQSFHRELFNRLRQASINRRYYVNRREVSQEQAMSTRAEKHRKGFGKKKAKESEC